MISDYIFTRNGKKHLVVEWLSWLPYKTGFISSNILETSKDRPNTPTSLKLLEQRVHELVGGPLNPLPPLDNDVGSKDLRSGRVKVIKITKADFYRSPRLGSRQKHVL